MIIDRDVMPTQLSKHADFTAISPRNTFTLLFAKVHTTESLQASTYSDLPIPSSSTSSKSMISQLRLTHHLQMLRPRTPAPECQNTWTPTNPPSPSFHPDFFRRGSTQHFLPLPQSLFSPRARTALSWTRPFLERRLGSPRRSVHLW